MGGGFWGGMFVFGVFFEVQSEQQQKTAYQDLNSNKSVPIYLYNLNGLDSELYSKKAIHL